MKRRFLCLFLIICILLPLLVACGDTKENTLSTNTASEGTSEETYQTEGSENFNESTSEQTTEVMEVFAMDRESVTLVTLGETFPLYSGLINPEDVVWSTDDAAVATISAGVVTAISKGETMVYGEYQGVRSGCKVYCNLKDSEPTDPTVSNPVSTGSRDPVMAPPATQVVDASFFDDAAFVGDSISLMLSNYCDYSHALGDATFLVRGSYGVGNEVVANYHIIYQGSEMLLEDALALCGANKVFIMLGMNDIGLYGIDGTIENWGKLLQRLRAKLPDIEIYIQSMTPVWTGGEVGGLNNKNVNAYNEKLQVFAQQNGCKFIDVAPYMKDSTGGLAQIYCSDNYVHLTEAGAKAWIQVLMAYTGY